MNNVLNEINLQLTAMQERMRKLVEESTKRKKEKKKQKMKEKTKKGPLQPVTAMANSTGKCILLQIGNLILIITCSITL